MFVLTVGFERKCDLVNFIKRSNMQGIAGISERCDGNKSRIEIYSDYDIREELAVLLTAYILGPFRDIPAEKQISEDCPFLSAEEKQQILSELPYKKYAGGIKSKILDYIKSCDTIDIPGFVRFRMPDFSRNVTADTAKCCDDFMRKREFEEMVSLLKYHIMHSDAKGTTEIVFSPGGDYTVTTPHGKEINSHSLPGINGIEKHDMILGVIMQCIPQKIILHNEELADESVMAALNSVFGDRIVRSNQE